MYCLFLSGKAPSIEELAERLNVPLETIDNSTKQLLKNLALQLSMVARQTGGESVSDNSTLPPELRPQSNLPPELRGQTNIPPELRSQSNIPPELRSQSNIPPELRPHSKAPPTSRASIPLEDRSMSGAWSSDSFQSKPNAGKTLLAGSSQSRGDNSSSGYCTSYPPPDMDESTSRSGNPVTVDYSHGRRSGGDSNMKPVTSESILASLQSDLTSSAESNNGAQANKNYSSSAGVPLKDKVKGFTQQVRQEIGSRGAEPNQQGSGNGFLPRQLQNRPMRPGNAMPPDQPPSLMSLNPARHMIGPRPGLHKGQLQARSNLGRKW